MKQLSDFTAWPSTLERLVQELVHFESFLVIADTDSTQDVARRREAPLGTIVLAGRQTGGRGRRGRTWEDDLGLGVSMTLVLPSEDPATACARGAVAMASALVPFMEEHAVCAGIKWPNDLVAMIGEPRKIGGILIEGTGSMALAGIGINVHARTWPDELQSRAATLEDAGVHLERINVIEALLRSWDRALELSLNELRDVYASFDVLKGALARFQESGRMHQGMVRSVDPFGGVVLKTSDGVVRHARERAELVEWKPRDPLSS